MIDKSKVAKFFTNSAHEYDKFATLQKKIGLQLISMVERCTSLTSLVAKVLDVGTGTAEIALELARKYPLLEISGCDISTGMLEYAKTKVATVKNIKLFYADAENLTEFISDTFDIVISNLCYQWVNNFQNSFNEVYKLLTKGGKFYFSIFSAGTLKELRSAFYQAQKKLNMNYTVRGQNFLSKEQIVRLLKNSGFEITLFKSHTDKQFYSDIYELFTWLKKTGVPTATVDSQAGLTSPKLIKEVIKIYTNNFRYNSKIFASFNVLLFNATKK